MNPDQHDTQSGNKPFLAQGAIARSALIKLVNAAGKPAVAQVSAIGDIPAFYSAEAAANGDYVDATPLTPERNHRLPLVGACNPAAILVSDGAGKVQALPAAAGTYVRIGLAEEAGVDGQLVLVRPHLTGLLMTVTAG
jgi:hypothetical protein